MRELLFIFLVIAVLLAITAVKYRRQIVTLITIWKQFQALRTGTPSRQNQPRPIEPERGIRLVNCARCGKWVAENAARRYSNSMFVCAGGCEAKAGVG
jgi:hypothetical protein